MNHGMPEDTDPEDTDKEPAPATHAAPTTTAPAPAPVTTAPTTTAAEAPHRVPMRTVLSHVAIPIIMGLAMALAYLGGFHRPVPHHLPVAVVGTPAQAGAAAAQIEAATGDALDLRVVPTRAQAEDQLRHLQIDGAFIPSATTPTLLTASAASDSTTTAVTKVFTAVALHQNRPLTVHDVVPVSEQDPIGQNGFFFLVPLSVGSYAAAIAIGAAGATRRFRERLGLVLGTGVTIATLYLAAAMIVFNMFGGHGPAVWALSVLYSTTVLAIGMGLHPLVGRFCTLLFSVVFVALNFTSSGGVLRPEMQNGFYRWLHDFWIGSGMLDALRHVLYFPNAAWAHALWILFGWFMAGLFCLGMAALNERRLARHAAHASTAWETGRRHGHVEARRALVEDAGTTGTQVPGAATEGGSHAAGRHVHRDGLDDTQRMDLELEEDVAV